MLKNTFIGILIAIFVIHISLPNHEEKKAKHNQERHIACMVDVPDELIAALIRVESKGDTHAVGGGGKSLGCLQLTKIYIQEVNEIYKTDFSFNDALNQQKSVEITKMYLGYFGGRIGRKPTLEDLARIHNGGPNGHKKFATKKYWEKVKKEL